VVIEVKWSSNATVFDEMFPYGDGSTANACFHFAEVGAAMYKHHPEWIAQIQCVLFLLRCGLHHPCCVWLTCGNVVGGPSPLDARSVGRWRAGTCGRGGQCCAP
jgi:hypothetical protein